MSMVPDVARPRPVWRPRRRRGPAQVTLRETPPPNEDYYYSPAELLRYQRVLTTRDVADLYDVTLATVRQWVARGHIAPTGKLGPSNVFDAHQVREAVEAILERSWVGRLKGEPAVGPIPPRYWDAIVTPTEAARLIGVSPSSIRSWLNRGHITRLQSSTSRAVELRLGDVVAAAARKRGRTPRKQPLI
jgi:transposase